MILLPPNRPARFRPFWDLTQTVRGVRLRYVLAWRPRAETWVISLWAAGEPLLTGRRLAADYPLTWRHRFTQMPPGHLVLSSVAGDGSECDREGLGHTHRLYLLEPGDLATAESLVVEVTLP